MKNDLMKILIGGEAGQGLATIGNVLCQVLVRSGYSVLAWQEFESRIRGGHNTFSICSSPQPCIGPREPIDLLVALDEKTASVHEDDMSMDGLIVRSGDNNDEEPSGFLNVPFEELAEGKHTNSVALGVVGALLGLNQQSVADTVEEFFGKVHPAAIEKNVKSVKGAYEWLGKQSVEIPRLPDAEREGPRLLMNGHEALALGALSAGMKFYSFYPMSPSTSIAATLVQWAQQMGVIVEQCEDEIAVLNMALGASFAGVPSLAGTSGGGFALMNEAVSLAGVSETPVVIVVAQRPGPATGLPTRTEQGDLEFVLHGGHGEFPRAVFTPGTVEECFHLTRKAFQMAALIHGPVFVLTDQYLADSYTDLKPFQVEKLDPVSWARFPKAADDEFLSYRFTDNGVSPRLIPGLTTGHGSPFETEQLVIGDSHEHTEQGHITEDPSIRKRMVEKRLSKMSLLRDHVSAPEVDGDSDPDMLIVSWGSTAGAAKEAVNELRKSGDTVSALHLPQVWPLPEKELLEHLQGAGRVVCVEGNATGQLARLIRRETGFNIEERVLRYDGRPITPEYILRTLDGEKGNRDTW